jgi:capsule polysaccharide export protein KpsE/RkpR
MEMLEFSFPNFNQKSLKGHGDFNSWTKVVIYIYILFYFSLLLSNKYFSISFKLDGMLAGCAGQQPAD